MPRKKSKPNIIDTIPSADIDSSGNVSHLSYLGETETLSVNQYRYKLICSCGNPRYYKSQDKKQVEHVGKCKPCLRKIRLERRKEKLRNKILSAQSKALHGVL